MRIWANIASLEIIQIVYFFYATEYTGGGVSFEILGGGDR